MSDNLVQEIVRVARLGQQLLAAQAKAKQADAERERAREIARELREGGMGCNCNLDSWEPERLTGHSWVCRIHKATVAKLRDARGQS